MNEPTTVTEQQVFLAGRQHGKRLNENVVRVQVLSSGQKHVTIPAPLERAANIEHAT